MILTTQQLKTFAESLKVFYTQSKDRLWENQISNQKQKTMQTKKMIQQKNDANQKQWCEPKNDANQKMMQSKKKR